MASSDREFVVDVIELYEELPCLWQVTHFEYHNKQKRNLAMEKLLNLFKTKDENANKDMVQKKIGSMRSSFRKENNKVKASKRSGAGSDEVHVPKLWYYDLLLFLDDQETPRASETVHSIIDSMPFGDDEDFAEDSNDADTQLSSSSSTNSREPAVPEPFTPKAFKRPRSKADQLLDKISMRMDQPVEKQPRNQKQKHDSFGEHVAEKLRSLPSDMVMYCQKMINEAIFFAELGNLNMTSRIVTDQYITPSRDANPYLDTIEISKN